MALRISEAAMPASIVVTRTIAERRRLRRMKNPVSFVVQMTTPVPPPTSARTPAIQYGTEPSSRPTSSSQD